MKGLMSWAKNIAAWKRWNPHLVLILASYKQCFKFHLYSERNA